MRINKFKNCIGLCACKGCFNFFDIKCEIELEKEDGTKVIGKKFSVCSDCAFDLVKDIAIKEE